jgi:excisionase family DNA binding protein
MAALATPIPNAVLSIRGTAQYLDCSVDNVSRLVKSGRLPTYRLGDRAIRIRISDIEDYLDNNRVAQ